MTILSLHCSKERSPNAPWPNQSHFIYRFVNNLKHWLCLRKQVIKIGGVRTPVLTLLDILPCRRQPGKLGQLCVSTFAFCSSWNPPDILSTLWSFPGSHGQSHGLSQWPVQVTQPLEPLQSFIQIHTTSLCRREPCARAQSDAPVHCAHSATCR